MCRKMSFSSKVNNFHFFHESPENLLAIAVLSFLLFLTIPYAHVLNKAVLHEKSLINQANFLVIKLQTKTLVIMTKM